MTEQQILSKLTALCSASEHCSSEMIEKMKKWEVDEPTQARVMEFLVREKYVDDARFCRFFVLDKIRFNKWGRRKVEAALFQKRIPKETAAQVLDDIDDTEYVAVLKPLLKQKEKSVKAKNDYEKNLKLFRFAFGRGFTSDVIKQVLDSEAADEAADFDEYDF